MLPFDRHSFLTIKFCGILCWQSVLKKVTKEDVPQISAAIMQSLMQMLHNSCNSAPGTGSGVQEDALLAVSALIEKLGSDFIQYMSSFHPYLLQTLKNTAEYQVNNNRGGVKPLLTDLKSAERLDTVSVLRQ